MLMQITCHILPGPSEGDASIVPILQNRKLSHSSSIAGKGLHWDLKLTARPLSLPASCHPDHDRHCLALRLLIKPKI